MTPTSGYILPHEMRAHYESSTSDNFYMGFNMITRPQPNGVRDGSQYGYDQSLRLKYEDAGSTGVMHRNNALKIDGAFAEHQYSSASALDLWSSPESLDSKTNGRMVTSKQSGIDLRVATGTFTSNYTGTSNPFQTSINAISLQRIPDNTNTNHLELTGNYKASPSSYAWTPFDENEAASAYVMKEIVVNNTLVVNTHTSEYRTYPVIRAVGGVD